jgi:hypothetical protein
LREHFDLPELRRRDPARRTSIVIACASSPAALAPSMSDSRSPEDGSIPTEHRAERATAVPGRRGRRYLQRQHQLDWVRSASISPDSGPYLL